MDPGPAVAHAGRGDVLAEMGRTRDALDSYGRDLQTGPAHDCTLAGVTAHGAAKAACCRVGIEHAKAEPRTRTGRPRRQATAKARKSAAGVGPPRNACGRGRRNRYARNMGFLRAGASMRTRSRQSSRVHERLSLETRRPPDRDPLFDTAPAGPAPGTGGAAGRSPQGGTHGCRARGRRRAQLGGRRRIVTLPYS